VSADVSEEPQFCSDPECKGHAPAQHPQEKVITWRSEPPPDFLEKNAGVTYRDQ
jgi:hypothetical protein